MKFLTKVVLTALVSGIFAYSNASACSRVTFATKSGTVITGRTMDWSREDNAKLIVYKRGTHRKGATNTPAQWTSKYGSIAIASKSPSTQHIINSAINEKGLCADMLWLEKTQYPKKQNKKTSIAVSQQLQYILDNFATVKDAVNSIKSKTVMVELTNKDKKNNFTIKLHFIITDKTGDNAIIEFINGEPVIYEQNGSIAFANDPAYDKMLAIKDYFEEAGGVELQMPGTALSQGRFLYLYGWLKQFTNKSLPKYFGKLSFDEQSVRSVLSLMRGVSTPMGVVLTKSQPNNTSTLWRTVFDLKNMKFYFDSATVNSTFWIDVNKIDFSKDIVISLKNKELFGDITDSLCVLK